MRTFLLTLTFFAAGFLGTEAQLLYKISGNGLEKPSYIIGTAHLANVGFVHKISGVKEALTNTSQVYGEVIWDDMMNPDTIQHMQKTMTLPGGKTLRNILSADQYNSLNDMLIKCMGTGLDNPAVAKQMGSLTPIAMSNQLTFLLYMVDHMGDFDPSSTFDQYFQMQAKNNNEKVGGLESVAFQTELLFNSLPMKRQIEQLMCLVQHQEYYLSITNKIANAFYQQDLVAIEKAMNEKRGDSCDSTPEENDILIYNRNRNWMKKIPSVMKESPTFFAVGAGHLCGEKGLIKLLEQEGYTVEAVK